MTPQLRNTIFCCLRKKSMSPVEEHVAAVGPLVGQAADHATLHQVLGDDLLAIRRLEVSVEGVVDHHRRSARTGAETAGADDGNLVLEVAPREAPSRWPP